MLAALFFAGLAAAAPSLTPRQSSNFNTDPNAPCGVQAFGYGPPVALTDDRFQSSPILATIANFAPAPKNYKAAFRNEDGSTSQDGCQGYYLLQTYNTTQCAEYCNNVSGCSAFNIFFERDPLVNPAPACPNPLPTNNVSRVFALERSRKSDC